MDPPRGGSGPLGRVMSGSSVAREGPTHPNLISSALRPQGPQGDSKSSASGMLLRESRARAAAVCMAAFSERHLAFGVVEVMSMSSRSFWMW